MRLNASPAESEAPGTEINRPLLLAYQSKTVDKLAHIEFAYSLSTGFLTSAFLGSFINFFQDEHLRVKFAICVIPLCKK
jgi:hypothetical protein